jgi:hypothetical protein
MTYFVADRSWSKEGRESFPEGRIASGDEGIFIMSWMDGSECLWILVGG